VVEFDKNPFNFFSFSFYSPGRKNTIQLRIKNFSQNPNLPKLNQRTQIPNSSKQENSNFFNRKIKINRRKKTERERETNLLWMILLSLLDFQNPPQNNKHKQENNLFSFYLLF
jgi:hypothetical protein